ncbi:Putative ribonuclease H protein [Dendrobium catenatum]|uniref:Ribonuclease H protein n=1 Tax=Dendrobium catenatum TaxID=906689 RepID=A0A2I0W843_9ASPA|nr:Putative ribonuclease H protein [Dendrobium catenatum]
MEHDNVTERIVNWRKPTPPFVKLNSDGSVNNLSAGAGGIIRDSSGSVLAAFAAPIHHSNAITAELLALNYGLKICKNRGFNNVWIEVDDMLLIQIINGTIPGNPQNFYLIREIKHCISSMNFFISHIYREANVCADWLAKKGCSLSNYEELDIRMLNPILKGMVYLDKAGMPYIKNV